RLYSEHGEALVVVHGACPHGADAAAARWCHRARVTVEEYPADWTAHGRAGGVRRNTAMVATHPDPCLAVLRHAPPRASHPAPPPPAASAEATGTPTTRHTAPPDASTPRPARRLPADRYLSAALDYAAEGLPVFLLGRAKRPVANCPGCPKLEDDPAHDPEA